MEGLTRNLEDPRATRHRHRKGREEHHSTLNGALERGPKVQPHIMGLRVAPRVAVELRGKDLESLAGLTEFGGSNGGILKRAGSGGWEDYTKHNGGREE